MSPRCLPCTFGLAPDGLPQWNPVLGEDELESALALSWYRKKRSVLPPFLFPFPFPSSPSPRGPGRAGGAGRRLPPPGEDPAAAAARRSRSRAALQDGPPRPCRSRRPPQAHLGHLGHRLDHPGYHPRHDGSGPLPGHCRHHLPGTDSPHTQWHRVSQRRRGTATLPGRGPQPCDPMLATLPSPMGHPESWGEMGRSRGDPAPRHLPLYMALTG